MATNFLSHRSDAAQPESGRFPHFRPHPLLRSGHAQTLAANFLHGAPPVRTAELTHHVRLDDGDHVVLHDDRPASWSPGSPAALLLHGLAGSHLSPYLVRAARKLNARNVRTFRMDYRTCGAGLTLANRPYHAGLSDDAAASLRYIAALCPRSPLGLAGYSMGGNVALKALGESPGSLPDTLTRAVVVNPAIDLAVCCSYLTGPMQRLYDRHFAKALTQHVSRHSSFTEFGREFRSMPVRRIREFDERFTVPHWGFGTVEEYYRTASAAQFIKQIAVPTLVLHSRDDPLIPVHLFEALDPTDAVTVHLTDHGGHLGFIGIGGVDPDRRWMDWRVVDWLTAYIGPSDVPPSSPGRSWRFAINGRVKASNAVPTPTIVTP